MALSNWDTLSFTTHGPSLEGAATNHENCTLEIYKNWVLATAPESTTRPKWWPKPDGTPMEEVARIQHGQLTIGHWQIEARRGPQAGVYIVATSARWTDLSNDGDHYHDKAILVGCGVYGYSEPGESYLALADELGMDPDTLMVASTGDRRQLVGLRNGQLQVVADDIGEAQWVGVLPESVSFLQDLVAEVANEGGWAQPVLQAVPWERGERSNQGDRYFGDHGVDVPDVATAPGAAAPPLLERVMRAHP
jgi:hypothetical protein